MNHQIHPDRPMRIAEIQLLTGLSKSKIRYWEVEFKDYLKPERTPGGQRQYTLEDLNKIDNLKRLLLKDKYTHDGARQRLGL